MLAYIIVFILIFMLIFSGWSHLPNAAVVSGTSNKFTSTSDIGNDIWACVYYVMVS